MPPEMLNKVEHQLELFCSSMYQANLEMEAKNYPKEDQDLFSENSNQVFLSLRKQPIDDGLICSCLLWSQWICPFPRKVQLARGDHEGAEFAGWVLYRRSAQVGSSTGDWSMASQATGESPPKRMQSPQNVNVARLNVRLHAATDSTVAQTLAATIGLSLTGLTYYWSPPL